MSYLDFLSGWWAGWSVDRDPVVQIDLRIGPQGRTNDATWLGAESDHALGSLIVWTDGAIEVEVLSVADQHRFHVYSGVLVDSADLASRLHTFVRACASPPRPEDVVGLSDDRLSATTTQAVVRQIDREYDRDAGFLGGLRSGRFDPEGAERLLSLLESLDLGEERVDKRLVQLLWFMPTLIQWQVDRVGENDRSAAQPLFDRVMMILEDKLGVP